MNPPVGSPRQLESLPQAPHRAAVEQLREAVSKRPVSGSMGVLERIESDDPRDESRNQISFG
jgi:hypothetical protein